MRSRLLPPFAGLLALATAASAAEGAPAYRRSAAELEAMVATPVDGFAKGELPMAVGGPGAVVLRRTRSGEAEVHDNLSDLFLVQSGRATIVVGGTVAGNREVAPGEWRGGAITGATEHEVGPGDVVWIPAGAPHRVVVPAGGDFRYIVVKSGQ